MTFRIRLHPTRILKDEFVYKKIFVILGLLYWVYGFTNIMSRHYNLLFMVALIPTLLLIIFHHDYYNFNHIFALLTLVFGAFTIAFNGEKASTFMTLIRVVEKYALLSYCSKWKSRNELEKELISICKTIVFMGTIILAISLLTYISGTSIMYYLSGDEGGTMLFVGRNPFRNSLCGIMANPNMISNLCIAYLGCVLCLIEISRFRLFYYIMIILDMIVLIYTASRGGLVGGIIIIGIYIWFKTKKIVSKKKSYQVLRGIIITSVSLVMILYLLLGGQFSIFSILNRTQENMADNTQVRFVLWEICLRVLKTNASRFLFGVGHVFSDAIGTYAPSWIPIRLFSNMHNSYLQMALEFGVPSAIMMIMFFTNIVIKAVTSLKRKIEDDVFVSILLGIVLSFLAVNLVESDMLGRAMEGTLIWIFAGYLSALTRTKSGLD